MNLTYKEQIDDIRGRFHRGELSYDDAKQQAQPILDAMNAKAREITKKYKKRHYDFTLAQVL